MAPFVTRAEVQDMIDALRGEQGALIRQLQGTGPEQVSGPVGAVSNGTATYAPVSGGPGITVPQDGAYIVNFGGLLQSQAAGANILELALFADAVAIGGAFVEAIGTGDGASVASITPATLTKGQVLTLQFRSQSAIAGFASRAWISLR